MSCPDGKRGKRTVSEIVSPGGDMKTLIQDIVTLTNNGWRMYNASPRQEVYESLQCRYYVSKGKNKPHWFVREDAFLCIGCPSRCYLVRPQGFQPPLPIRYEKLPREMMITLTPDEILARHDLLNVRQAAYVLNVSERTIYDYIACGKLIRLKEKPVRVRRKEVLELKNNFDE